MSTAEIVSPTPDEKLMGALAHLFGPLVAVIVWAIQKDKSRFVNFQALQALVFALVVAVGMGAFFFCLFGVMFLGMSLSMFSVMNNPPSDAQIAPFFFLPFMFPFMTFAFILPSSFVLLIIRLLAAVCVLNGRNYRYLLIGKWLDGFLEN